jgi:hypothetical protein
MLSRNDPKAGEDVRHRHMKHPSREHVLSHFQCRVEEQQFDIASVNQNAMWQLANPESEYCYIPKKKVLMAENKLFSCFFMLEKLINIVNNLITIDKCRSTRLEMCTNPRNSRNMAYRKRYTIIEIINWRFKLSKDSKYFMSKRQARKTLTKVMRDNLWSEILAA